MAQKKRTPAKRAAAKKTTRKTGAALPRAGAWTGYFLAVDMIIRRADLALDRNGSRLSGELSILVDQRTGSRARVRVTGTASNGRITLKAALPKSARLGTAGLTLTGHLVESWGEQTILALTEPPTKLEGAGIVGGIPVHGSFVLQGIALTEATRDQPEPAWVEETS